MKNCRLDQSTPNGHTFFCRPSFYTRLSKRIRYSKAIVATVRKLLIIIYCMLTRGEKYGKRDDDLTHRKITELHDNRAMN